MSAAEVATGINAICADTDGAAHISYYSPTGLRLSQPTRGINILRSTDAASRVQATKVWCRRGKAPSICLPPSPY